MFKKHDNPWNLTPQQSATMDAVCTHGCQKAAAKVLGVSLKTVEQHTRHAAQRMGLAGNRLRKYIKWDRWMQRRDGGAS